MFLCDIPLAGDFLHFAAAGEPDVLAALGILPFRRSGDRLPIVALHVVPLLMFGGGGYLKAVDPRELQAFALVSIKLYDYASESRSSPLASTAYCSGYLILKSTYLPKALGVLLVLAGFAYVVNSFALLAVPAIAGATFIAMFATASLPTSDSRCGLSSLASTLRGGINGPTLRRPKPVAPRARRYLGRFSRPVRAPPRGAVG